MGNVVVGTLSSGSISSNAKEAFDLFEKSWFGEKGGEKVEYMGYESLYLFEQKKLVVVDRNQKEVSRDSFLRKIRSGDSEFETNYVVYRALRNSGFVVKSGLKFGAPFRVYEKSQKKRGHAKWLVFPVKDTKKFSWHEFSAKNRVAHSTKKNLLIAVVDAEKQVSYFEIHWKKI